MATARPPGRPRDPDVDEAVRTAARELIREGGARGVSMAAVAARAGVGKPTLYLRYPNRTALIADAVFGRTKATTMPDTGSLRDDLRVAYGWLVAEFAGEEARAVLPTLLAEMNADPDLRRTVRDVIAPEYARVGRLLERARDRGEVHARADLALAIDTFVGAALARAILLDAPLDDDFTTRTVDLIVDGLRARE